jgi:hypothetical protein
VVLKGFSGPTRVYELATSVEAPKVTKL